MENNSTRGDYHKALWLLFVILVVVIVGLIAQARATHASGALATSGADAQALLASSTRNSEIPTNEFEALKKLYESTQGDLWFDHTAWMENESPCSWYGIVCDDDHVVEIYLSSNRLVGNIPESLGQMECLRYLDLSANK